MNSREKKGNLLARLVVLKDELALQIGLVDVEGVSQRARQPRKLNQHFFLLFILFLSFPNFLSEFFFEIRLFQEVYVCVSEIILRDQGILFDCR